MPKKQKNALDYLRISPNAIILHKPVNTKIDPKTAPQKKNALT